MLQTKIIYAKKLNPSIQLKVFGKCRSLTWVQLFVFLIFCTLHIIFYTLSNLILKVVIKEIFNISLEQILHKLGLVQAKPGLKKQKETPVDDRLTMASYASNHHNGFRLAHASRLDQN